MERVGESPEILSALRLRLRVMRGKGCFFLVINRGAVRGELQRSNLLKMDAVTQTSLSVLRLPTHHLLLSKSGSPGVNLLSYKVEIFDNFTPNLIYFLDFYYIVFGSNSTFRGLIPNAFCIKHLRVL